MISTLEKQIDDVMRQLSKLSAEAKRADDSSLMYALNRAWTQLYEHRKKPAAVPAKEPEHPRRRAGWHYDSQGYCDNPGRGY